VDDLRPALGRRVRTLRQRLNLSQEQLAERAGLHWTYVSGIERGRRNPGLNTLGRLAQSLEVDLPELVEGLKGETFGRGRRQQHRRDSARRDSD
jgi:transcriptional regulator with XRE-family HTH domain